MEEGSDATRTTARGPGLCQRQGKGAEATVHQIHSVASIRAAIGSQRLHPVAQPSSFLRKIIKAERKLLAGWGAPSHRGELLPGPGRALVLLERATSSPCSFQDSCSLGPLPLCLPLAIWPPQIKPCFLGPLFPLTPFRIIWSQAVITAPGRFT